MLLRIRSAIVSFAKTCYGYLSVVVDKYTYAVPIILGTVALCVASYLTYTSLNTLEQVNQTIKSIPDVIQSEMLKTRETIREESTFNRDQSLHQHAATRKDLQDNLTKIEIQRKQEKKQLSDIQKKLQESPKRKKFLGIF